MYSILVIGGGYTGSRIAQYYRSQNQKVTVIKRTESGADELRANGIQTIAIDLCKEKEIPDFPKAHFLVFALAPQERTESGYENAYIKAARSVLDSLRHKPKPLMITYLSSTGVYGAHQAGEIDAQTVPEPDSKRAEILLEAEKQVLLSGYRSAVIRLSGIYGPGRNRIEQFKAARWPLPHQEKFMNMIHVNDIVNMMTLFFKRAKPGEVYLASDDEPVAESVFYDWLANRLGVEYPKEIFLGGKAHGKRYNNLRLKALGIPLTYPNFRTGYEEFLRAPMIEKERV